MCVVTIGLELLLLSLNCLHRTGVFLLGVAIYDRIRVVDNESELLLYH